MNNETDFCQFYDLESYLFGVVRPRFAEKGELSAFDFFCIVVWKANRAKSKIAANLLRRGENLEQVARQLTHSLFEQPTPKEKLRYLIEDWGFRLPMASAVLTVLYPDEFTVYDDRVRRVLGFRNLANLAFEKLWAGYGEFKRAVEESTPTHLALRDKDRYLWGKSFYDQLKSDVEQGFKRVNQQASATNLFNEYLQLPTEELEWEL